MTGPEQLLRLLSALETVPPYRFQVELRLVRLVAAQSLNLEIDALCIDLDRHFRAGELDLNRARRAFERALLLTLYGDAALRREDRAAARRWIDAAVLAAEAGGLDVVARAAAARLS